MTSATTEERAAWTAAVRRYGATRAREVLAFWAHGARAGGATVIASVELSGVDPSWLEEVAPAPPPVRLWLERDSTADLVDMTGAPFARAEGLRAAFESIGLRRVALAARAAPEGSAKALAARFGETHGRRFLDMFKALADASRDLVRAAVKELALHGGVGDGDSVLFRAGARHVAPGVAALGGDAPRQLAQRLPKKLGLVLLEEVGRVGERTGDLSPLSDALA